MRRLVILVVCCWATPVCAQLLLYDGFEYLPLAQLAPDTDTDPENPLGLHNVEYEVYWRYAGSGVNNDAPHIAEGSLTVPGMPAPAGNRVTFNHSQTGAARINIPTAPSSGTVYWSAFFNIDALGTLRGAGNSGVIVGGLNNSQGPATSITSSGAVLYLRPASNVDPSDTTHYHLGTGANTSQNACTTVPTGGSCTDRVFADGRDGRPRVDLSPDNTLLVVASYEIVGAGNQDDIARLWINPDPGTFGADSPPTATITAMSVVGTDALNPAQGGVSSFHLRNNNQVFNQDTMWFFDELRVGTTWASVTSAAAPPSVAGDYNGNGVVDAADYTTWRDNEGAAGTPGSVAGDGDDGSGTGVPDGMVNAADYDFWKARFGETSGAGAGAAAVPEPASWLVAMLAIGSLVCSRSVAVRGGDTETRRPGDFG